MPSMSRRTFFQAAAGLAGVAAVGSLSACTGSARTLALVGPGSPAVAAAERARRVPGRRVVSARLTPRPVTVDLGGRTVETWAYGEQVPGPLLRARAGDLLRVTVDNQLPVDDERALARPRVAQRHGRCPAPDPGPHPGRRIVRLRVHRPRPGHVLLPPALRRTAGPRPVRRPGRRRPRRARRLRRRVDRRPRRLGRRHRPHPRPGPRRPPEDQRLLGRSGRVDGRHGPRLDGRVDGRDGPRLGDGRDGRGHAVAACSAARATSTTRTT